MTTTIAELSAFLLRAQRASHGAAAAERAVLREPLLDNPTNRANIASVYETAGHEARHFAWLIGRYPAANDSLIPVETV